MADYEDPPTSPDMLQARAVLGAPAKDAVLSRVQGGLEITVRVESGSAWIILRRPKHGGIALRVPLLGPDCRCDAVDEAESLAELRCTSGAGSARIVVSGEPFGLEQLRVTMEFTPRHDLAVSQMPRDLVPFAENGDPVNARGTVEAVQRRMNTGLLYCSMDDPAFGKVLYIQNLTALNAYFNATGTVPQNVVGGTWPDVGFRLPVREDTGQAVLPARQTLTLYDAIVVVRRYPEADEDASALQFLDMLGAAYPWLGPPPLRFRDWVGRAEAALKDLATAPEARITHYEHTYFHPYTGAEYPDAMVQLSLLCAISEWGLWQGKPHPLEDEAAAGLAKFYDPKLRTIRRYLPNVGKDKNADAVDSWYLYHPMLNLANLALAGREDARALFLDSVDYGIRAARHFKYKWPIMYDVRDFSVIRDVAEADDLGQTDVGGIYAWVMLQAFELTHEARFLEEARNAIEAAKGMRFDLNYQANLTAWGAAACIRLWRITNVEQYLDQSYVYLASFFHNAQIWKSDIGIARHYTNFMGVTCLQDAPYMAAYECFDSFAAFERYLDYGGPALAPSVKLLVGEFCRYALDRAWYYYPDALPEEAVAQDGIRNGVIRKDLNFPLEDLYPDDQRAGQVGQEIYGAGAAMVYATRAFHRPEGAPFILFCDHFIRARQQFDETMLSIQVDGVQGLEARLIVVPDKPRKTKIAPALRTLAGTDVPFVSEGETLRAMIPCGGSVLLRW